MVASVEIATIEIEECAGACSSCASVGSCSVRTVCRCLQITEDTVIGAIRDSGAGTIRELKLVCGAGDGCMGCHNELKRYLEIYSSSSPSMCCAK